MTLPRPRSIPDADIQPGLLFAFDYNDDAIANEPPYSSGPWMVITHRWVTKLSGGYWEYLCLSSGPTLEWHSYLGKVYIISDPKSLGGAHRGR